MKGQFQWLISVSINESADKVWAVVDDISLIPQFHPEVKKVELLSGQKKRALGVKYQCIIPQGSRKGSCVEEIVEYIPGKKMSVSFPEDSWGINKKFDDFIVETTLIPQDETHTILEMKAYYNPNGIFIKLINFLFLRKNMRREALDTIKGIKRFCEQQ